MLVHGVWHGGWCWSRVRDSLSQQGHRVFTPTLTGLGERRHLLSADVDLDTHIADVVNVLEFEGLTDVILVGHSYGGWVISGVAEQVLPRLASLVFVDAPLPRNGERMLDQQPPESTTGVELLQSQGRYSAPVPSASRFGVNDDDIAWVEAKMTPHPLATLTQPIRLTGAREAVAKKMYICATESPGRVVPPHRETAEVLADHADWDVRFLPCGHDVMVDMPDELTATLLEYA